MKQHSFSAPLALGDGSADRLQRPPQSSQGRVLPVKFGVAGASRYVCRPTGMKNAPLLCILLTLCACRTSHRSAALPADAPPALNSEFLRADHARFSKQDRDLIATAWHGILQADKLPEGGSEDAYYRVRHTSDGHEVYAIYVTGYAGNQPVSTPCVHNEVLLSPEGEVLRVLSGPECWP